MAESTKNRPWNRARTNDEFLAELYEIRKDVEPLDEYVTRSEKIRFKCLKCGNIFITTPVLILKGRQCDNCRPRKIKYDLTGKKFGYLKVIKLDETKHNSNRNYWLCECKCGKTTSVSTSKLNSGYTRSCGCYGLEQRIKATKKYNKYDISKEYGIGYTNNTNREFYFDLDDYDKIKCDCWNETPFGYITNSNGSFMHRLIMNCENGLVIDHINHNKRDNRKNNLRACTQMENNLNTGIKSTNTSGKTGVQWEKRFNKWRSRIIYNGKDIHLGLFDNYEDAVKAREDAEIKYFKEFRYKGE